MTDQRALIQRAQAQTQANRYAYVVRVQNAKLAKQVRTTGAG